jgi:hypothetical protein
MKNVSELALCSYALGIENLLIYFYWLLSLRVLAVIILLKFV